MFWNFRKAKPLGVRFGVQLGFLWCGLQLGLQLDYRVMGLQSVYASRSLVFSVAWTSLSAFRISSFSIALWVIP